MLINGFNPLLKSMKRLYLWSLPRRMIYANWFALPTVLTFYKFSVKLVMHQWVLGANHLWRRVKRFNLNSIMVTSMVFAAYPKYMRYVPSWRTHTTTPFCQICIMLITFHNVDGKHIVINTERRVSKYQGSATIILVRILLLRWSNDQNFKNRTVYSWIRWNYGKSEVWSFLSVLWYVSQKVTLAMNRGTSKSEKKVWNFNEIMNIEALRFQIFLG